MRIRDVELVLGFTSCVWTCEYGDAGVKMNDLEGNKVISEEEGFE